MGEVLEQTSYYITYQIDAKKHQAVWVKCWNRPVTISPIASHNKEMIELKR